MELGLGSGGWRETESSVMEPGAQRRGDTRERGGHGSGNRRRLRLPGDSKEVKCRGWRLDGGLW